MSSMSTRHRRKESLSYSNSSAPRSTGQNLLTKTPTGVSALAPSSSTSSGGATAGVYSSGSATSTGSRRKSRNVYEAAAAAPPLGQGTSTTGQAATAQSSSATQRRIAFDYDDDSDDDDDALNVPQLSDLAKRLLGTADGINGEAAAPATTIAAATTTKPSAGSGLKRKQSDGSSFSGERGVSSGSKRDSGYRASESRSGSPSGRDFVTPAPGRQFRRTAAVPSSAHNSGGSSSGGSGNSKGSRDINGPHETPAYASSVSRPTGSVARQWQTTTRRPTRGLTLGLPIRGPKRDPQAEAASSPDDMIGQDIALGQPAPSYDLGDVDSNSSKDSRNRRTTPPPEHGSTGKSSTRSRSASRSAPRYRVPSPMEQDHQASGSPPPKAAKYAVPSAEREKKMDREVRDGSPQPVQRSSSRRSPPPPTGSPEIKAERPIDADGDVYVSPIRMLHKRASSNAMGKNQPKASYSSAPMVPARSEQDKENLISVPSFKKSATAQPRSKKVERDDGSPPPKPVSAAVVPPEQTTPQGAALATRSSNTPHRMAPPPPKMPSAIQMQTARAGAAAAATTKRQNVVVNGIKYLRLDQIGRGGSAKVYRVMADNYKMMAMKKVVFEHQHDQNVIRGFKGEIDLLRKLKDVDRVVKLYDFELNEAKGTLTVLLECGELDLNKMICARNAGDDSQLDLSFLRFIWKEMLECVDAVHQHNIVHSDLKPANFVLVQGRLKLIDFGIANAIQDDTVNVYREQQVGTISYMSPEAIADYNQGMGNPGGVRMPKLYKLGAPSDVWSLGCILYQMTYGRTPFAHLANMFSKMQAIPNPKFQIEYPSLGIGGVPVPRTLIETLKNCLERDKDRRVTIRELLSEQDRFLNPDREKEGMVDISEETLVSVLENAAEYTTKNGRPSSDHIKMWANDVYNKLKRRMFERQGKTRG